MESRVKRRQRCCQSRFPRIVFECQLIVPDGIRQIILCRQGIRVNSEVLSPLRCIVEQINGSPEGLVPIAQFTLAHERNRECKIGLVIPWSGCHDFAEPSFSSSRIVVIAPIPEANANPYLPSSSDAIHCSSALRVGFTVRE